MRNLDSIYDVVGLVSTEPTTNKVYDTLPRMTEEQLLAIPDLSAVAIETHINDACPTALRALSAGKHIHLDKPD